MLTRIDIEFDDTKLFWYLCTEVNVIEYDTGIEIWEEVAIAIRDKTPNDHFGPPISR